MWSCDYFGRKVNIQLGAFFSMFGGALQSGANSLAYVIASLMAMLTRAVCSKLVGLSAVLGSVFW